MLINKSIRFFFAFISVILIVCIGFQASTQMVVYSAQTPVTYVEDIRIIPSELGKTGDAEKWCKENGYVFTGIDLNEKSGNNKNAYLCYKTTDNRDKAITNIRALAMDDGYTMYDYNGIIEKLKSQNAGTAHTLYEASKEFVKKYNQGSPRAKDAYEALNLFYVSDDGNQKLGDYILNGKITQDFFIKLLVKADMFSVDMVFNLLNVGIQAYQNDFTEETQSYRTSNWAQMLQQSNLAQMIADDLLSTDELQELDRQYNDLARDMFTQIQDFTTLYENAKTRYAQNGNKYKTDLDTKNEQNIVDQMDEMDEEDTDVIYLAYYETLNEYQYNDEKLGDWLIKTGHETSAEFDFRKLYPVVEAMGPVQAEMSCKAGFISAIGNLGENITNEEFKSNLSEIKNRIRDYNGKEAIDLWEAEGIEYKDANIAFTEEIIRKSKANHSIGQKTGDEKFDEVTNKVKKWLGIGTSCLFVAIGTVKYLAMFVGFIAKKFIASCVLAVTVKAACSSIVAAMGVAASVLGWISLVVMVLTIVVLIGTVLYRYIRDTYFRHLSHTIRPDYVFDVVENRDGQSDVRYKSVRGATNKHPIDINVSKQYRWVIFEASKDKQAGSPVTVTRNENGADITFRTVKADMRPQSGYDSVKYFGSRNPSDLNEYCSGKKENLYLHYTTEASLKSGTPAEQTSGDADDTGDREEDTTEEKNYIRDMIVGVGRTFSEAKAKVIGHDGKYYFYDYNLSPDQAFATCLGYTITTDPQEAITDLRIAPYAGSGQESASVSYGDVRYTRIGNLGFYTDPGDKTQVTQNDALYYTKDANAGSPILVDSLHAVTDPANLHKDGMESVSFFGNDLAYNFNSRFKIEQGNYTKEITPISGSFYGLTDGSGTPAKSVYLCYEPETKYTSGTQYLSGLFFYGGHDISFISDVGTRGTSFCNEVPEKLLKDPRVALLGRDTHKNLAQSLASISKGTLSSALRRYSAIQSYIGFTWSYNPKRAVTDVRLYQGDTYSASLNYTTSKVCPATGQPVGYVAASFLNQQEPCSANSVGEYAIEINRYIDPSNCFRNCNGMCMADSVLQLEVVDNGYTEALPKGIPFGWKKHHFLPTALYVGGHQKNVSGLTLDDVVITEVKRDGLNVDLSDVETLSSFNCMSQYHQSGDKKGKSFAKGEFYPLVDMKNPHETEPFNLAYPDYYNAREKKTYPGSSLYLYLRGPRETKRTYVSSVSVGSFSRQQYKSSHPEADDKVLKSVDRIVNSAAMMQAAAGGSDETLMFNWGVGASNQANAWYNRCNKEGMAESQAPENVPAAYLSVSRTSNSNEAITGVLLWQDDTVNSAANEMTYDDVKYVCDSTSCPVYMNGHRYYLYYTKNTSVSPGLPIEDIKIDNTPIISGYATNLCGNAIHSKPYGSADQTGYIHLKYTSQTGDYFNHFFIGVGATKRAAQCDLLGQGCVEYIDIDINGGIPGDTMLLGFRKGRIQYDEIDKAQTEADKRKALIEQTQEAVYDIVVTNGEEFHKDGFVRRNLFYYPVSNQNLNDKNGDKLYLYVSTPWYSAKYNRNNNAHTQLPQDVFSGYISNIAFAEGDRVPYNTSVKSEEGETVGKWEYVMEADNVTHADMNSGETNFDSFKDVKYEYAKDARIAMFTHRSDNSVKPAGEITGGFLEKEYTVGKLEQGLDVLPYFDPVIPHREPFSLPTFPENIK